MATVSIVPEILKRMVNLDRRINWDISVIMIVMASGITGKTEIQDLGGRVLNIR